MVTFFAQKGKNYKLHEMSVQSDEVLHDKHTQAVFSQWNIVR